MNISMVNVMKVLAVALFVAFAMNAAPTAHAADLFEDYTGDVWYDDYGYTGDVWSNDYGYTGDTWYNDYGYTGDVWSNGTYYDDVSGGTYYDDVYGTYYDDVYGTYYDDSYGTYYDDYGYSNYGCGSYCGGYSYSTPSFSIPGCSFCGGTSYSPPRYSAPSSSYSNVVNTNTNVNNITNTNIDNSINDSFNNYNSNNTSLVVTAPQTPVYTQPAPYCTITHAQYGGYGSGAYLSWSATNASSAYISGLGSVSLSGSQTVYPGYSTTYTMTVYGYNGQQATCATTIHGTTYNPPVYQQPYVSLTQIPYTGFDLGPIGNAMYWAALASFAVAGAYLMVYYLPQRLPAGRQGALTLATAFVPARRKFVPVVAPKAPILVEKEAAVALAETKVQPIVASLRKAGTLDSMAIVTSKDGSMPTIVIQRT